MNIKTIPVGPLAANCYVVSEEAAPSGKKPSGIVIDPGFAPWKIQPELENLNIEYIILTHSHFDHILAADKIKELTGAGIVISERDAENLGDPDKTMTNIISSYAGRVIRPDITVKEGDVLSAGSLEMSFIETPGHTEGSMCIRIGGVLFTGDTLFKDAIGRTDFAGGDYAAIRCSLKRLCALEGNLKLYPGHNEPTDLDRERRRNPYLKF